jgi:UTP:GlnB (protein PII) uridylyltransferase
LKEEKIRGEVIPITLTKGIVTNLSQSILTSQKDFIDYLLIRIGKEAKLSGEQMAKLRGEMIKALNETVDKAIKASQRNIKSLMYEFSVKKEVGEHD